MPFDPGTAQRVREQLQHRAGIAERRMFGGLAFLQHGHLVVAVLGEALIVRVGPLRYAAALAAAHVRPMDLTGRPLRGFVVVDAPGIASDDDLARWVEAGRAFVATLPPKAGG